MTAKEIKKNLITMHDGTNIKFRRRMMPPSSRYKKYLKMEAPGSFEALATSYQSL
jgi:hypothetical protein